MSPPKGKAQSPAQGSGAIPNNEPNLDSPHAVAAAIYASTASASEQVSFWEAHTFLEAALAQANVGPIPRAGSPAWCDLAEGDPRKLLSLALDGVHHVLRVEVAQTARAEASRDVSGAADWPKVAREIQQRNAFYAERPWLRRAAG